MGQYFTNTCLSTVFLNWGKFLGLGTKSFEVTINQTGSWDVWRTEMIRCLWNTTLQRAAVTWIYGREEYQLSSGPPTLILWVARFKLVIHNEAGNPLIKPCWYHNRPIQFHKKMWWLTTNGHQYKCLTAVVVIMKTFHWYRIKQSHHLK